MQLTPFCVGKVERLPSCRFHCIYNIYLNLKQKFRKLKDLEEKIS